MGSNAFGLAGITHHRALAAWVGTAKVLLAMKDQWRGTLMFVGQPAEENTAGAKRMLNDGLFTRFSKPDFGFALHVYAAPLGDVLYRPGVMTSNQDFLEITFRGRGAHGSFTGAFVGMLAFDTSGAACTADFADFSYTPA